MGKKVLALALCAAAMVCFALPFVSASMVDISGFSAAVGYSFLGYDVLGANLWLIFAFLLGVAAIVLVFTRFDVLCPVCNVISALLLLGFRVISMGPTEEALSALFSSGVVGGGVGLWAAVILFIAAAAVRILKRKRARNEEK